MTKEQANEMLELLKDIRQQVTRVANATKDGTYVFYPDSLVQISEPGIHG